ncbi:mediator of RNA polymerase II transcription subunit 15-like [Zingiber officinale]|uniref:mediator of RNA polymerase II transcription subunit 15-like n=1 Tax=Zingiber officinale TaxID=94328 RepID=UPI001C4B5270|nr:mediator of RNA polymerase II transcription subunit 15-like [Zingiber officinale]
MHRKHDRFQSTWSQHRFAGKEADRYVEDYQTSRADQQTSQSATAKGKTVTGTDRLPGANTLRQLQKPRAHCAMSRKQKQVQQESASPSQIPNKITPGPITEQQRLQDQMNGTEAQEASSSHHHQTQKVQMNGTDTTPGLQTGTDTRTELQTANPHQQNKLATRKLDQIAKDSKVKGLTHREVPQEAANVSIEKHFQLSLQRKQLQRNQLRVSFKVGGKRPKSLHNKLSYKKKQNLNKAFGSLQSMVQNLAQHPISVTADTASHSNNQGPIEVNQTRNQMQEGLPGTEHSSLNNAQLVSPNTGQNNQQSELFSQAPAQLAPSKTRQGKQHTVFCHQQTEFCAQQTELCPQKPAQLVLSKTRQCKQQPGQCTQQTEICTQQTGFCISKTAQQHTSDTGQCNQNNAHMAIPPRPEGAQITIEQQATCAIQQSLSQCSVEDQMGPAQDISHPSQAKNKPEASESTGNSTESSGPQSSDTGGSSDCSSPMQGFFDTSYSDTSNSETGTTVEKEKESQQQWTVQTRARSAKRQMLANQTHVSVLHGQEIELVSALPASDYHQSLHTQKPGFVLLDSAVPQEPGPAKKKGAKQQHTNIPHLPEQQKPKGQNVQRKNRFPASKQKVSVGNKAGLSMCSKEDGMDARVQTRNQSARRPRPSTST